MTRSPSEVDQSRTDGLKLKAARETVGWTRRQMGRRIGIAESNLRNMEMGLRQVRTDILDWAEMVALFLTERAFIPPASDPPRRRMTARRRALLDQPHG